MKSFNTTDHAITNLKKEKKRMKKKRNNERKKEEGERKNGREKEKMHRLASFKHYSFKSKMYNNFQSFVFLLFKELSLISWQC